MLTLHPTTLQVRWPTVLGGYTLVAGLGYVMIYGLVGESDPGCKDAGCKGFGRMLSVEEDALYNGFGRAVWGGC